MPVIPLPRSLTPNTVALAALLTVDSDSPTPLNASFALPKLPLESAVIRFEALVAKSFAASFMGAPVTSASISLSTPLNLFKAVVS